MFREELQMRWMDVEKTTLLMLTEDLRKQILIHKEGGVAWRVCLRDVGVVVTLQSCSQEACGIVRISRKEDDLMVHARMAVRLLHHHSHLRPRNARTHRHQSAESCRVFQVAQR